MSVDRHGGIGDRGGGDRAKTNGFTSLTLDRDVGFDRRRRKVCGVVHRSRFGACNLKRDALIALAHDDRIGSQFQG